MRAAAAAAALLFAGLVQTGCAPREPGDDTAPAPYDTLGAPGPADTTTVPDTSVATPPITPPQSAAPQDTPPAGAPEPNAGAQRSGQLSQAEYDGWRQYSVNCARCHGQDALPNPVAANLLVSLGPNGPMRDQGKFSQVVSEGRPDRGMPAFKGVLSPEQIQAVYAYLKGRADKRIPSGRPTAPAGG
jgi:mono/diheme cytochrome c family protein